VEEVILGLLTESDVASGVATSGVALTCTAPDTAPWMPIVTLAFLVRLFSEAEVLVHFPWVLQAMQGFLAAKKSEFSVPQSALTLEFSVSSLPSVSSARAAVSWT